MINVNALLLIDDIKKKINTLFKFDISRSVLSSILSVHTIKAHYLSIDNDVFEGIYKDVQGCFWSELFKLKKLEGKHNKFSHFVSTDGYSMDFH